MIERDNKIIYGNHDFKKYLWETRKSRGMRKAKNRIQKYYTKLLREFYDFFFGLVLEGYEVPLPKQLGFICIRYSKKCPLTYKMPIYDKENNHSDPEYKNNLKFKLLKTNAPYIFVFKWRKDRMRCLHKGKYFMKVNKKYRRELFKLIEQGDYNRFLDE